MNKMIFQELKYGQKNINTTLMLRILYVDIQVADNARYENAIDVALRSVTPPDIILKVWPQTISEFANNEFLLPVSDYYD